MTSKRAITQERKFLEAVLRRLPEHPGLLRTLADLYPQEGLYKEGYECDLALTRIFPHDDVVWYNFACACALMEEPERAMTSLKKALELGYSDLAGVSRDPDLRSLHGLPEFKALLKRA